jgi:LysM repeat protein
MNENRDREMNNFMDEIADALGKTPKNNPIRGAKSRSYSKSISKAVILGAMGVCIVIIVIVFFSQSGDKRFVGDLSTIQARLNQLERRITQLESMQERLSYLEQREQRLSKDIANYDRAGGPLVDRLNTLSKRVKRLEKTSITATAKTGTPLTSQRGKFPLSEGGYHVVKTGDTLYWIAQHYGTSVEKLCRLNKISSDQVIHSGQKLLVAPKITQ